MDNLAILSQLANVDQSHPASESIHQTLALLFKIQKSDDQNLPHHYYSNREKVNH
jgi:hypothetical protein